MRASDCQNGNKLLALFATQTQKGEHYFRDFSTICLNPKLTSYVCGSSNNLFASAHSVLCGHQTVCLHQKFCLWCKGKGRIPDQFAYHQAIYRLGTPNGSQISYGSIRPSLYKTGQFAYY